MIESNLVAGRQDVVPGKPLTYGQSITDGCIDWDTTVSALNVLADAVTARRNVRSREVSGTFGIDESNDDDAGRAICAPCSRLTGSRDHAAEN